MPARRIRPLLLVAALPLLLLASSGFSPENPRLRRLVERGRHPAIRWGRFSDVQADARRLYERNGWVPLWLGDGRPTREARALLDVLATAGDRGLDPQDYDATQLRALAANLDRRGADAEQAIRFDAALTIGVLRFTRALARGRIGAREAGIAFTAPSPRFDPVPLVETLRRASDPAPALLALEPTWSAYRDLRHALGRYRQLAKDSVRRRPWYQARIRQIELALERWRWMPRELGGGESPLLVNVPALRLQLTRRSDQPAVGMSVRIESERCRRLQVLGEELRLLVFRPSGSSAAVRFPLTGGLYLFGNGPDQRPGPASPVETGCIRVADGELLAELLLRDRPEWTRERIRAAMAGDRQRFVRLTRPVPVLLVYGTAVAAERGQVVFSPDRYGHDRRLAALLSRGYPYPGGEK